MQKLIALSAAALLMVLGARAEASTTTLSFGGTLNNLYDGGLVFGSSASTQYRFGTAFTGSISFTTPTTSTGACTTTSSPCSFALTNVTESLTVSGATKSPVTFLAGTGTLQLFYNGGNSEQIVFANLSGPGISFTGSESFSYGQLQDGNSFFATSPVTSAALSFGNLAISGTTSGNLMTSSGTTSIGLAFTSISASTTATAAVPEPVSLALLGTGLGLVGLIRRRRTS